MAKSENGIISASANGTVVDVEGGQNILLNITNPDLVVFSQDGSDLVITYISDASKIVLDGFFSQAATDLPPQLTLADGTVITAQEVTGLIEDFDPDAVAPAAGGAPGAGGGAGFNAYDDDGIGDGIGIEGLLDPTELGFADADLEEIVGENLVTFAQNLADQPEFSLNEIGLGSFIFDRDLSSESDQSDNLAFAIAVDGSSLFDKMVALENQDVDNFLELAGEGAVDFIELVNNSEDEQSTGGNGDADALEGTTTISVMGPDGSPVSFDLPTLTVAAGGKIVVMQAEVGGGVETLFLVFDADGNITDAGNLANVADWPMGASTSQPLGVLVSWAVDGNVGQLDTFLANGAQFEPASLNENWQGLSEFGAALDVFEDRNAFDGQISKQEEISDKLFDDYAPITLQQMVDEGPLGEDFFHDIDVNNIFARVDNFDSDGAADWTTGQAHTVGLANEGSDLNPQDPFNDDMDPGQPAGPGAAAGEEADNNGQNIILMGDDVDDSAFINDEGVVEGGRAQDFIIGDEGDNEIDGGAHNDFLDGGAGNDLLDGGSGGDVLIDDQGNDILIGGTGTDVLFGRRGAFEDSMYGGGNNVSLPQSDEIGDEDGATDYFGGDVLIGDELFEGGGQNVTFQASASFAAVNISGQNEEDFMRDIIVAGDGSDVIFGDNANLPDYGPGVTYEYWNYLYAPMSLVGADGYADYLRGMTEYYYGGADLIYGGWGDDIILGQGGDDLILAGHGNDIALGGDGNDVIRGNLGFDSLYGGSGNDSMYGGGDSDFMMGMEGDDLMYGGSGADEMYGNSGNDIMSGGEGADQMYGGSGNDIMDGDGENDAMYGGSGNDLMSGGTGRDAMYGQSGDDTLYGGIDGDVIYGGIGNDSLLGEDGSDLIFGGDDNDTLSGGRGADQMYGGSDDDVMSGDRGADQMYGGSGADDMSGGRGADIMFGESGADDMSGGRGTDIMYGGSGNDSLFGDQGGDVMYGGSNADYMSGGRGADVMFGEAGADEMLGDRGNDLMYGGAGDDEMSGGRDNDTLDGNSGSDNVDGDAGDDVLRWTMSENAGETDNYDGGSGTDTLELYFTAEEFADYEAEIAKFSNDVEDFGSATLILDGRTLNATNIEYVAVHVDGEEVPVLINDEFTTDEDTDLTEQLTADPNTQDFIPNDQITNFQTPGAVAFTLPLSGVVKDYLASDWTQAGSIWTLQLIDSADDYGDLVIDATDPEAVTVTLDIPDAGDSAWEPMGEGDTGKIVFKYSANVEGDEEATVTINVNGVDDEEPQVAVDDIVITNSLDPIYVPKSGLLANDDDFDEGDRIVSAVTNPSSDYDNNYVVLDGDNRIDTLDPDNLTAGGTISENIPTEDGEELTLTFTFDPIVFGSSDSIEVVWNGVVVDTISGVFPGETQLQYEVFGAAGETDTLLEFRGLSDDGTLDPQISDVYIGNRDFDYTASDSNGTADAGVDVSYQTGNELQGGDANEIIVGGEDADTIRGGAGDDTLLGGEGDDLLIGGAGSDVYMFGYPENELDGNDEIRGYNEAEDTINLDALFDELGINGAENRADLINMDHVGGDTVITIDGKADFSITVDAIELGETDGGLSSADLLTKGINVGDES